MTSTTTTPIKTSSSATQPSRGRENLFDDDETKPCVAKEEDAVILSATVSSSSSSETATTAAAAAAETATVVVAGTTVPTAITAQPYVILPRPHADEGLLEPFQYLTATPGKAVRSILIDTFQYWFQVPDQYIVDEIKSIIQDLHNASLLVDDIEDNSILRRGIPVAHHIFGTPLVINCSYYVIFMALERCHALHNPAATNAFVQELTNLHIGQGHDILWRERNQCPTEEQYYQMIRDKTGGLFRLAVHLVQAFASQHGTTNFDHLIYLMSEYFQIRDDLLNIVDQDFHMTKTYCEDLTEGKFSLPVIHCIRQNEKDTRLLNILKQRTQDVEVKKFAVRLMREAGSLDYAREKCRVLYHQVVDEVQNNLGGNPGMIKLMHKLNIKLEEYDQENQQQHDTVTNGCYRQE